MTLVDGILRVAVVMFFLVENVIQMAPNSITFGWSFSNSWWCIE